MAATFQDFGRSRQLNLSSPGPVLKATGADGRFWKGQMRIYLAARYSRREELCGYRRELEAMGHNVQARWLNGEHQLANDGTPIGENGESLIERALRPGEKLFEGDQSERATALRTKFAQDDWEDVTKAEMVVSFTEPPRSNASRGGRHVEFGIALANRAKVVVVGFRENIFHWLPPVRFCKTWEEAKTIIAAHSTYMDTKTREKMRGVWWHMWDRCTRKGCKQWSDYGGRGISVCDRWRDFENFLADMGVRPSGHTLERINNNGNYEPSNCRWATHAEQARNTRRNRYVTYKGERMLLEDAASKAGVSAAFVLNRIRLGWSEFDALHIPSNGTRHYVTLNGKRMMLAEASRQSGIPDSYIVTRLKMGWSEKEALTKPVRKLRKWVLTVNGVQMNVCQAARATGIDHATIIARLYRGWSPEDAIKPIARKSKVANAD